LSSRSSTLWERLRRVRALPEILVVSFATIVRFVGIGFSPSTPWGRPDEEIFQNVAMRLFSSDDPGAAATGWPEGWFRVHHLVQAALRALWSAEYGTDVHMGCALTMAPARMLLPVRVLSALLSIGTVVLVMRLARRIGPRSLGPDQRRAISIVAGLFFAVDVASVRDAHFAVSDQPLMFLFTWMMLAIARGMDRGRLVDFLSCGIAVGLAIGTKWTGLTFAIIPVLALAWRFRLDGMSPSNFSALLLGVGGALAAFLLTNPSFVHGPQPFLDGIASQTMRYDPNMPAAYTIFAEAPIELGLTRHLRVSLPFALGWPIVLLAIGGTLMCVGPWARRGGAPTFLVGFWSMFFHVVIAGRTTMYFARYSLPIHPTLCVAAAVALVLGTEALVDRFRKRRPMTAIDPERVREVALLGAIALVALEPTLRSIEIVSAMHTPETRERAAAYVHAHVGDAPIDITGGYSAMYGVPPRTAEACTEMLPPGFAPWVIRWGNATDPFRSVSAPPGTWSVLSEQTMFGPHRPSAQRNSEWMLVTDPYQPCGRPFARFTSYDPPACYTEVQRWEPEGIDCDAMWDDQDHFYAPLWGFSRPWWTSADGSRIGPRVILYRNECHPH
jgi:hypothetical protein